MTMTLRAGPLPSSATQDIERRALQQIRGFLLTAGIQAVNGDVEVSSIRCDGTRGSVGFTINLLDVAPVTVSPNRVRDFEKPVVIAVDQSAPQDVPIVFNCTALGSPAPEPGYATITVPGGDLLPVGFTCRPDQETMCLQGGQFQAKVTRLNDAGQTVAAQVVARSLSDDSGYLWFFNEANIELTVKVLNGCAINNRFWVFFAATTNVQAQLTVIDTRNGQQRVYFNPGGPIPRPLEDEQAFATCR